MPPSVITSPAASTISRPHIGAVAPWPWCAYEHRPRARFQSRGADRATARAATAHKRRDGINRSPAPPELARAVPRWRTGERDRLIAIARQLAELPTTKDVCRRYEIAVDTWLAITINDLTDADTATGWCSTAREVAAARVNRDPRVATRARAVSARLGLAVELYRGRELTRAERIALTTDHPGHGQRGLPSVWAYTVMPPHRRRQIRRPRPGRWATILTFVHLPPEGAVKTQSNYFLMLTWHVATATRRKAPPPAAPPQRKTRARTGTRLAWATLRHPALARLFSGARPGATAAQFAPFEEGGWCADVLAPELATAALRRRIMPSTAARSPYGLLRVLLRSLDPLALLVPAPTIDRRACQHLDCDGHGWINRRDDHGYETATPCPRCPASLRASTIDPWEIR